MIKQELRWWFCFFLHFLAGQLLTAQDQEKQSYKSAHLALMQGINQNLSLEQAVFIVENAFLNQRLNQDQFTQQIDLISKKLVQFIEDKKLQEYKTAAQYAVYSFLKDSSLLNSGPYVYDFDDFMGDQDWQKMFVTKLLATKSGNCHSIPLLFKILTDRLEAESFLSLAPNHLFIKHKDEQGQWVNVELTSGAFPGNAWYIEQLDISLESIQQKSYLSPLSYEQMIGLCLFDLACGYETKFGLDTFYLEVVESAIKTNPNAIPFWLCKRNYMMDKKNEQEIIQITEKLKTLGFQEKSHQQYLEWVRSQNNSRL